MLHRDIAARNCLYGNNNVKIADFGLSREGTCFQMDPNCRVPIRWLAPEIMETAMFTQKTDVWAYGVMIWEIYNDGLEPYPGMSVAEVAQKVRTGWHMEMPFNTPSSVHKYMENIWSPLPGPRPSMTEIVSHFKLIFPALIPPAGHKY